jgi:hypothetical protein
MRLFLVLTALISILLVPRFSAAATVSTIDELADMYKIEACAECHEDIHNEWKDSWHGKPIIDPRVLKTWRTFVLSGLDKSPKAKRRDLKDVCLPCHAPQTKDISDELATKIADLVVTAVDDKDKGKRENATKELSKLNINCLVCHNLKANADGKSEPGAVYGPKGKDVIDNSGHEESNIKTIKSDYLKTSEFCAQCHHGCPPDMPSSICPTLYTSYKEDFLAHGGTETCQDCHMTMTEDEYKSHRFPGIYEVEQVKKGIDLKMNVRPTQYVYHLENRFVPAVVVKVDVTNTAGHTIPHG